MTLIFSLKALKNPQVDAESIRPYLDFVDDVIVDPSNNRKFTYMCKGALIFQAEQGGRFNSRLVPEYIYATRLENYAQIYH